MKRTFPQKVKPVPSCVNEDDGVVDQSKQALSEVNRRSRTSAAMIGLAAISVGAHGLLLAHQTDEAIAAEPASAEPSVSAVPSPFDVAAVSSSDDAASSTQASSSVEGSLTEHTVQEEETLWQIAQFYGADAVTVATLNGIPINAVLHVGQVLKVPADSRVGKTTVPESSEHPTPGYYGLVREAEASAVSRSLYSDAALKAKQDAALSNLKQKREELRVSLSTAKGLGQTAVPTSEQSEVSKPQVTGTSVVHSVVKGDTLSAIAKAYGISQKTLAEANGITNPDMIRVNQLLNIPQANTASSSDHASLASQAPAVPNLIAMAPKSAKESGIPVINASTNSDVPQASGLGISFQRAAKPAFQAKIASLPSESTSVNGQAEDTVSPATADSSVQNNQVATAPLIDRQSTQSGETTSDHRYNYVENLRLEIVKLREKYKHAAIQPTVSSQPEARVATVSLTPGSVPSSETASGPVNPELSSSKYAESVRSQVHKLQARAAITREVSTSAASLNSASQPQSQLVATSSIGSENYEPLLPSSLGKMVSPDLPPLGSVDSYLPGAAGKFKGYIWPAKGLLTSGYGWRWGRMHKGIDVAAPIGTPVMAAASGVVITAGWNSGGYGNMVEIQHPDGSVTLYAHNNRILVREGQQVEQGQQIAEMGSTGYSTGPHCHFEVHLPGHGAVNPIAYLPRAGA